MKAQAKERLIKHRCSFHEQWEQRWLQPLNSIAVCYVLTKSIYSSCAGQRSHITQAHSVVPIHSSVLNMRPGEIRITSVDFRHFQLFHFCETTTMVRSEHARGNFWVRLHSYHVRAGSHSIDEIVWDWVIGQFCIQNLVNEACAAHVSSTCALRSPISMLNDWNIHSCL